MTYKWFLGEFRWLRALEVSELRESHNLPYHGLKTPIFQRSLRSGELVCDSYLRHL